MTERSRPARIVDRWATLYTAGLPADVGESRRAELASDVWEQLHDSDRPGTLLAVLGRLTRGVPADLVWRVETRYHLGGLMSGTVIIVTRILAAIATLVTAFFLFWALAWTEVGLLLVATAAAVVAIVLWLVSTTPVARERRRRAVVAGSIGGTIAVAAAAIVAVGAG